MSNKDLFIPFERFSMLGGPATFMRNLRKYLDMKNYGYSSDDKNCGGMFFPIAYDLGRVERVAAQKLPVIQRLDGVHYEGKHGAAYAEMNREWEIIYNRYATSVIFQSEYSKKQCFRMFGEIPESKYTTIINGVDKEIFYPSRKQTDNSECIRFITTGSYRNIDMLEPVIKAFDTLSSEINFELNIVGPVKNPDLEKFLDRDYVRYHGAKELSELAELLRTSDVYIYSHLNPPCPNSVLEAISCGLPVVGFNSGSMSELLFFAKELLADVSDEVFQVYEDFDYKKLREKILFVCGRLEEYQKIAKEHSYLYSFEKCCEQYQQVFIENQNSYRGLKGMDKVRFKVKWLRRKVIDKILKSGGNNTNE